MNVIEGVVKNGRVVPTGKIVLPEGSKALITIIDAEEDDFWLSASEESAAAIWDNTQDDVYAELLTK